MLQTVKIRLQRQTSSDFILRIFLNHLNLPCHSETTNEKQCLTSLNFIWNFQVYLTLAKLIIIINMTIEQSEISQFRFGTVTKLAKTHNVSRVTVYDALQFRNNSEIAQKIRKDCIDNYGARVVKKIINV